jgi:ubiquinol-cytochrome c reductase cytochrome c1 subunit
MNLVRTISAGLLLGLALKEQKKAKAWIYRDDIGAFWGIKGYEEQICDVGSHHGKNIWPHEKFLGAYNAGSVRRGFQVFAKNCANCHGMIYRKYDFALDKGYKQQELAEYVTYFTITPGHHHFKQYYYQEWGARDRVISDRIYAPYLSQDHAKNANDGVFPTDFSKIRLRPGNINYIYNILTGYHYNAPYGLEVPKGKHFNPYFDHMIIGMPRQLFDGMIDFDDGTPASTPQMAYDVSTFITYMQRRGGGKNPDRMMRHYSVLSGALLFVPFSVFVLRGRFRNYNSYRREMYAVRDGVYYSHFKSGMKVTIRNAIANKLYV